jgi:hypothetical protein
MTELNKEFKEGEDMAWQFGCNLTVAGWEEIPNLSDKLGTMYQKNNIRIYLDETGVFVFFRGPDCIRWIRVLGQSFDEMLYLSLNQLTAVLTIDLLQGLVYRG